MLHRLLRVCEKCEKNGNDGETVDHESIGGCAMSEFTMKTFRLLLETGKNVPKKPSSVHTITFTTLTMPILRRLLLLFFFLRSKCSVSTHNFRFRFFAAQRARYSLRLRKSNKYPNQIIKRK